MHAEGIATKTEEDTTSSGELPPETLAPAWPSPPPPESVPANNASQPSASSPAAATPPRRSPYQAANNEKEARALINQLLPAGIPDRNAWTNDLYNSFSSLKIPYTPSFFCASIAVLRQESNFQSEPVIPGLGKMAWGEIENRSKQLGIPHLVLEAAFTKTSPNGQSYNQRINALKTKKQMNELYEDIIAEIPFGKKMLAEHNPIRSAGPMQVGVAFAQMHVKAWPYPYPIPKTVRDEVFTRRGSVYFGTAHLLQYPANYSQMIYRFADYNAGRYASRGAAFQMALSKISGKKLIPDGYLMSYKGSNPDSSTLTASQHILFSLADQLGLSRQQILSDISQERLAAFAQTPTFKRVFALADRRTGKPVSREALPQIRLVSPELSSTNLTTAWFAGRVQTHYQDCLARLN